jgi:flavin reductase (DIM6/NTAB) family NADH-FMN oxidoreductase RutF
MQTIEDFDARQLRNVLGSFVTGVTVVTTVDGHGKPHGLTANSFTSVSLDPPLVLWNQAISSPSHPVFRDTSRFAINILAEHQIAISQCFARPSPDKFNGVAVTSGLGGIPLIKGCAATLECRKVATHVGGDHAIFIGHVERIAIGNPRALVFGGGKYLVAHPHGLGELSEDGNTNGLRQVRAVRAATWLTRELAAELNETLAVSIWTPHGPTVVNWEPASKPASTTLRMGVVPLLGSATGRLFAALLPPDALAITLRMQSRLDALPPQFESALVEIREQGHSISEPPGPGSNPSGLRALSVPVFDKQGVILLAITALRRIDGKQREEQLLQRLKNTAQMLSQQL